MFRRLTSYKPFLPAAAILFTCLLSGNMLHSQVTKIVGTVTDSVSGKPIPFANVFFNGTTIGVSTDFDGKFALETAHPSDTLVASSVGYKKAFAAIQRNRFQEIHFILAPDNVNLPEIIIVAGENPAEILLRKIISHKELNNKKEFSAYQYEVYNKIEIDANNISEQLKDRRIMRPFRFVFDYVDTSTLNGKPYLPIFLSESLSDYYFRKNPRSEREIIKAAKVSGVENESVLKYLGEMFQKYSIYDNFITLFQKNFISPVSDNGLFNYRYYLIDSTWFDGKWCYKIMFKPRRKQELTFTGHFWVHDTTYAVKSFEMRIAEGANINFINDLMISQEFDLIDGRYWMVVRDAGIGDFNVLEDHNRTIGFFGRKTTTYRNFVLNQAKEDEFYSSPVRVIVADNAYKKDETFWVNQRHEALSKDERTIYYMVDTLRNLPAFKTWIDIIEMVVTGYWEWGKVELGPYMSLVSFNAIEGGRIRLGGRTTSEFSQKTRYHAHIAYGTRDRRYKAGVGFMHLLNSNPRRTIEGDFRYDIEQLGNSPNAFREDFLLAAVFRRNPADKLSLTREFTLVYEHEWFQGFSSKINLIHKEIIPVGEARIEVFNGDGELFNKESIQTSEARLDLRLALQENYVSGDFDRISLGTKYPILGIQYGYGIPGFLDSEYEYHRLSFGIRHWFNIWGIGWSKYFLEAGKIWGTLPFPLLKLHPGNETFILDETAFNLMNYFEFVSDQYLNFYYSHHFDGFFLNHIPLMRRLKWREVTHVRGVMGSVASGNMEYNKFPLVIHTLHQPYFEAGLGIENIFKIFRVDAVWRLSHLSAPDINRFALFVNMQFTF
ncbi:MAG: carboxypeptidase-like regulatory domain-containing protein [Bacteroidales bacterium]|nr:carboxypeptidase-like regulatory domain-containing protein [Bacteroidales bacterium]